MVNSDYTDYDKLFKLLVDTFLLEFLELYFAEIAYLIKGDSISEENCELLDLGELRTKIADLVFRVQMRDESSRIILHIEGQEQRVRDYNRQMFSYFVRLHEKYPFDKILPIVVFSSGTKIEEMDEYILEFTFLQVLKFKFLKVQLKQIDWKEYKDYLNPVAAAMLSRMKYSSSDKIDVKLAHTRMIADLNLPTDQVELVIAYFDSGLSLTAEEKVIYQQRLVEEFGQKEREKIMRLVTSYHLEGFAEGMRKVVKNMLEDKMPLERIIRLTGLPEAEVVRLTQEFYCS